MKHFSKRYLLFLFIAVYLITTSVITGNMGIVHASSTTESFNTSTGTLNVNYAGYLSKQDIVFNSPITNSKSGITVGNGRIGAQVWNSNGITMQISGVDDSEEGCFSQGLVNLYTNPGMDTGYSTIQQRLSLYNGTLTTQYDSNRTVTIMGSPNSEVMGINVSDTRSGVTSVTVDISIWDLSSLPSSSSSMGCDVPDMTTWKTVSTYNDSNGAGISRGQTDANHFGYTLAGSVQGASFTTSVVNSSKVRLTITPTSNYTIWIACASRLNAPNYDSVTQAKNLLTSVESTGYSTTLTNYENWWHNFWSNSFVQYSNSSGDADYLENFYYLSNYMIAAGAYGNYSFQFINGDFSGVYDNDYSKWSGAYWYWNQRDVYNSFLASNHISMMDGFLNLYNRNSSTLQSYTSSRFGFSGIWVPETMGFDGNARHTMESSYTDNIMSTGAEVAQNMYMRYKYTNDSSYLSNTAYPFMKQVCTFYANFLTYNSGTGKYYVKSSNAHETYWNVQDAITDLAAVHALFPMTIQTAQQLGVDSSLVTQWQNIVNNLDAYHNDGTNYLPCTAPVPSANNDENVACELVWPYSNTGIGDQMAINTWNNRPFPYGNVWSPDAVQAARLGMGSNVYSGMKTMLNNYQNLPNGRTNNSNGEFEYIGVHDIAMNESLLQSYNGIIRVFPALPSDSSMDAKFTLLASGGFLVSSEMEASDIKYIGIKSLYGNTATVINPWGTTQVDVRRESDNSVILTTSNSQFSFSTAANTVYVIERTSKLLSSYTYQQITANANQGVKTLSGTSCSLGSVSSGGSGTRYEAENGTLNDVSKSADSAASGGYEVTGFSTVGASSVTFSNVVAGSQLTIGYCTANNPGKLDLYINGTLNQALSFPTTNSWSGTYSTITVNVTIPAGATIKLQLDTAGGGTNLDYIQIGGSSSGTKYEAENGTLNDVSKSADSAASGGYEVTGFSTVGASSVTFSNVVAGSQLTIGYCTANNPGKLDLYINGTLNQALSFPDTNSWSGTYSTIAVNVTIPAGATIKLQLDTAGGGTNLDYIIIK